MAWRMLSRRHACAAQVADVRDKTNKTQFTVNYYPPTEGRSFKPGTCRTVPHTDESLITLLLTSPGKCHSSVAIAEPTPATTCG